MKRLAVLFCFICLFLVGCAPSTYVTPMDSAIRQPTASVDVYADKADIKKPYKQIAMLNIPQANTPGKAMDALLLKAKAIGANGVIITGQNTRSDIWSTYCSLTAIAIVYLQEPSNQ